MSDADDPFGPGGKTVIRPTPGGAPPNSGGSLQWPTPGGQPQQPQWPTPGAPPQPQAPPQWPSPGGQTQWPNPGGQTQWPSPGGQPPARAWPAPGSGGRQAFQPRPMPGIGGMSPGQDPDAWLSGAAPNQNMFPDYRPQQPSAPAAPKIPLAVALSARDGGDMAAANPITAAATPLLILLGRLRVMIVDMQARPLMEHFGSEVMQFERRVRDAGVSPQDAQVAKYALCATADDIVQNLPGTDRDLWLKYSMVAHYFGDRTSGVGFYDQLTKILHNPAAHYDLLELMHACLSLGFEGGYRATANGQNELQKVRRDVYAALRHVRSRLDDDISPRWRGLDLKMKTLTSRVPVWAIGSAAAAILLAVYFMLRFLLGGPADTVADRLAGLHSGQQVQIERASFVPAPVVDTRDPTQIERIRGRLPDELRAGGLAVDGIGDYIVIRVPNILLFASGSATVGPEFSPLAVRIAQALQTEPGPINIIGHTDNVKPSGVGRFKSNQELSEARAAAVAAIMTKNLTDPSRLTVEGRGDYDPIAENATDKGRAQNRRVEIMIPREETLPQ